MESSNSTTGTDARPGVIARVRDAASAQVSTQKDRATDTLGTLASAVRQSTRTLRDQQQDTIAQYVERAADQIDRFSATLRSRDLGQLMADAQRFARRQPAVFIGAAFAAGVLAARFLKSSGDHGGDERWRDLGRTGEAADRRSREYPGYAGAR